MALMRCPECGREVSNQAEHCPACAFPIARHLRSLNERLARKRRGKRLGWTLLILLVGGLLAFFFSTPSTPTTAPYTEKEKIEARRYWENTIPHLINAGLIDRYTMEEDVLVVYVNGAQWRRRSPETQEAFLSTVSRSNYILGGTPRIEVRDRLSGEVYAARSASPES